MYFISSVDAVTLELFIREYSSKLNKKRFFRFSKIRLTSFTNLVFHSVHSALYFVTSIFKRLF